MWGSEGCAIATAHGFRGGDDGGGGGGGGPTYSDAISRGSAPSAPADLAAAYVSFTFFSRPDFVLSRIDTALESSFNKCVCVFRGLESDETK